MKKTDYRRDAKVLIYDLECSPLLGWAYEQYQTNLLKVEQAPVLLAFSWKWLGEKGKPHGYTILDFKQSNRFDDSGIVRKLWELLDECEVAVAYNGKRFDDKMANTFFLKNNMTPPSLFKEYDPLQTARRFFKFGNNKLDYLGGLLINEHKTETTHSDCWYDMLYGDKRTQKKKAKLMDTYCRQDVVLLEKIYNKLLPWATNHPNMSVHAGEDSICPRCGHAARFRIKAYRKTGVQVNAIQLECGHCHSFVTRPLTPEEKEEYELHGSIKAKYRNSCA